MAVLKTPEFVLEIVYIKNAAYIKIVGHEYSAEFTINRSYEEFRDFAFKLKSMYESLKEVEAKLQEDYEHDFLCVKSDGLGHFIISGEFNNWTHWNLKFTETVDQTFISNFLKQLSKEVA